MTSQQRIDLDQLGYAVFPAFMPPPMLERMTARIDELFAEEGDRAGSEFRQEAGAGRLANLVDKGEIFREAIVMPEILEGMAAVLGPKFKLSSLNARSAKPHSKLSQPLHADMSAIPDEHGYWVCNSVWMLDAFTVDNGALRAVPGSHRWKKTPQQAMADPSQRHPDEVLLTGAAGTVIIMNAHLWHGGTENRTDNPRRALHGFYCRWDKPQQQYQKALLREETISALSPQERGLLAIDDNFNDRLSEGAAYTGFLR